jgi:hypothetical protein
LRSSFSGIIFREERQLKFLKNIVIGMAAATGFILFTAFWFALDNGFDHLLMRSTLVTYVGWWVVLIPVLSVGVSWWISSSKRSRRKAEVLSVLERAMRKGDRGQAALAGQVLFLVLIGACFVAYVILKNW